MIFGHDISSVVFQTALGAPQLWWADYGNYVLFGVVVAVLTICFFVIRRKE